MYFNIEKDNIPKSLKSENFRLNGKRLFLTYSQTEISREEVLIQLNIILENNIQDYVISKENHKETGESHIHAYIVLKRTMNIVSASRLDLIDTKTSMKIHGSYEVVKNKWNVLNYVKKEDKYFLSSIG